MLVWVCCVLVTMAQATKKTGGNALVLLEPSAAGPHIPLAIDDHPLWVRWPDQFDPTQTSRLFAAASGRNWRVQPTDFSVRSTRDGFEITRGRPEVIAAWQQSLRDHRGGLTVRAVPSSSGALNPNVIAFAFPSEGKIVPLGDRKATGLSGELWVYSARDWDEVAAIQRQWQQPISVLEWPALRGGNWSHLWIVGETSPVVPALRSVGFPGVIPASDLLTVVSWQVPRSAYRAVGFQEPGPPRSFLLDLPPLARTLFWSWMVVAAGWIVFAEAAIARERRSRLLAIVGTAALLFPGLIVIGTAFVPGSPVTALAIGAVLWLASALGLASWIMRGDADRAVSVAGGLVAGAMLLAYIPASPWSGAFSPQFSSLSGTGLAAFTVGAGICLGTLLGSPVSRWVWVGRLTAVGLAGCLWWVTPGELTPWPSLFPVPFPSVVYPATFLALIPIAERWWRPMPTAILLAIGMALIMPWRQGVTFSADGLAGSLADASSWRLDALLRSIGSPIGMLLGGLLMVGLVLVRRFTWYQLGRFASSCGPTRNALAVAILYTGVAISYPSLWPGVGVAWTMATAAALIPILADPDPIR